VALEALSCLASDPALPNAVATRAVTVHTAATLSWLSSILAAVLLGPRDADKDLLSRIASGDQQALKLLYGQASDRVMAIALRVLKDRSEAEDVVQETFVEVWKRAKQFDAARGGAAAWVITIARNRAIDRVRAKGSSARTIEGMGSEPAAAPAPAPLEIAEQRRDRERVLDALGRLPAEQRRAVELAYFDGLTQSEIASETKEPLGTVKTRIRLAMAKLADMLSAETEGAA
jgi:RNA polymerase sigma-70 factor (ECF subfamily)